MKVFFFYLLREGLEPTFYAYTSSKEIRDYFLEERNPQMFYVKEVNMNKKELSDFERSKKEYELARRGFVTKTSSSLDSPITNVYVISTGYEELNAYEKADKFIYEIGKHEIPMVEVLNKEVLKALDDIYYFQIQKWLNMDESFLSGVEPFDFTSFNLRADIFAIFLRLYGYTFKKKIK